MNIKLVLETIKYDGSKDLENALRYFVYFPWCKMINHNYVKNH